MANGCWQLVADEGKEDNFPTYVQQDLAPGNHSFRQQGADFLLESGEDCWTIGSQTGELSWARQGSVICRTEPGLGIGFLGWETLVMLHLEQDQTFVGLGEKTGPLKRNGSAFTNWNTDAFAYHDGRDPLYVSIPFYMAEAGGKWYGVFLDNPSKSKFNFGASNNRMVQIGVATKSLSLWFIPGPDPIEVLKLYHQITGTSFMPPKWALGLQQCRYSYYPAHELESVAQNYRYRDIPCDVLYLDIHYMQDYKVFTVDKKRFPDLKGLCDKLLTDGFRVVPIQDPGIRVEPGYAPYDEGEKADIWVKYPDGKPWVAGVWPGWCVFPDYTMARAREWWTSSTRDWVLETGVSGLWNDMNEPASWGQDTPDLLEFDLDGRMGNHLEARNIYGQLMAQSTRKGLQEAYPGQRSFVLTRAGFAGIQRHAAVWSGDNVANEEHYFLGIRLVLSLAISGVPFSGPDVGGFVDDAGKELFVRWISVAAFFPFFRLHSMIDSRDNEPWSYGELAEAQARNFIRLRYRLLPELYSAFFRHTQTGDPILHPSYWENPELKFDVRFQHQFIWCGKLLIIPAGPSAQAVLADFPAGQTWYPLLSTEPPQPGGQAWVPTPLGAPPIYVKGGSILITKNPGRYTTDPEAEQFDVHIFFGEGQSSAFWHEDDGLSTDQKEDAFVQSEISFHFGSKSLQLKRKSGSKKVSFQSLYLWHFPAETGFILISEHEYPVVPATYDWVDPLPNFDPFENKSCLFPNSCLQVTRPGGFSV
jgi:alpha-glucosidase